MIGLIIGVLAVALILSLGCNVRQEFELETLRADNADLLDALSALQSLTETYGTGTQFIHVLDLSTRTHSE